MNHRTILSLILAVGLIASTAGATALPQVNSSSSEADNGTTDDHTATQSSDDSNYTRLYIADQHRHLRVQPGETKSVTVTVENGEDESVDLSPHVVVPPRGQPPIEQNWVTIESDDTSLDAGESREFEITVSVPDDAEIRRYSGTVAFTDETIQYPGRPEQPVHGMALNVEVWKEPTVQVQSTRYVHTQVKAGESFTREITIKNTGDQAVPVNPQVQTENQRRHVVTSTDRETLDRSWVSIDAPSEISPGETATVELTVSPPSDAERGQYSTEVNLGLKDPARAAQTTSWQQVRLRFQVWSEPDDPFETSFDVSDDASAVELDLSTNQHPRASASLDPARFDVSFVAPNGTAIDAERVEVTDSGNVNLGNDRPSETTDETYATGSTQQTFSYRIEDPAAGTWSVEIMPENTMRFDYEISRTENN